MYVGFNVKKLQFIYNLQRRNDTSETAKMMNGDITSAASCLRQRSSVLNNQHRAVVCKVWLNEQEAQLMLTLPRDAFRGQSRSPNMVPFHVLGMFTY